MSHKHPNQTSRKIKIPASFQGILWSKNIGDLDLTRDKVYIIHQILSFGNFRQIKWLFKVYPPKEIQKVFLECPKRIYTAPVFYFVKNFLLNLKKKKLAVQKYVRLGP